MGAGRRAQGTLNTYHHSTLHTTPDILCPFGFPLQLVDRLMKKLAVELEADCGDMAGLLGAEEAARATDLEIAHCDFKAGAEFGVLFDRAESFFGISACDEFIR